MDPLKLLVSVTRYNESLQKVMDEKVAELSILSESYKKRSLGMMRELHEKEMLIKNIQKKKIESQSGMFIFVY